MICACSQDDSAWQEISRCNETVNFTGKYLCLYVGWASFHLFSIFLCLHASSSSSQAVRRSPLSSCRRRSTVRLCCCWRRNTSCPQWTSSSALRSRSAPTLTTWETDYSVFINPAMFKVKPWAFTPNSWSPPCWAGECRRYSAFSERLESVVGLFPLSSRRLLHRSVVTFTVLFLGNLTSLWVQKLIHVP